MKLAIHHSEGSFSTRWIAYCKREGIDYKIVDCYQSDIMQQLKDCDALMWHHHHGYFKDVITVKKILFALEHAGIKVFPDFKTGWHFDDKVAQKYLLEAIDAPLVPSFVFYDKKEALDWAENTVFPKVFKLKGGAGAANVKLVRTKGDAVKLIHKSFGKGFSQFDRIGHFKERYNQYRAGKDTLLGVVKGFGRLFVTTEFAKLQSKEKGYVYFQEFIPNNNFDIRVIVIGEKAFALKRMTRENDFRASGSGNIIYDKEQIDENCVRIAFEVNQKIQSQSIAYDFVFDEENNPLIVEICYGYAITAYDPCPGYWDDQLNWHTGQFNPQEWMVEELVKEINK
jgi:glutathione synthase/RimK-type ligase-like ATP-grasp enzyme